ncbi:Oligo-1,6-glucosidase [anaerobic digester metagenome]
MLNQNHTVGDVMDHPLGQDILLKLLLQIGISRRFLGHPLIRRIRLSHLPRLTGGKVDEGFVATVLELLNSEPDVPGIGSGPGRAAWWKEAVFYQIYPKSFMDSNGDGVGDLGGILAKLDYLQNLGVDALWLTPIYDSPEADNGYDIRDYQAILSTYGTMADFDALIQELHRRGMRLIMDLVVNHTSDEHRWFQEAMGDPASPKGDYYFFRDDPNNWVSFFGGSAWKRIPQRDQWVLHLFSERQMDLNWDNPALREEIFRMVRSWLDRGVDGFRLDVINYISKRPGLPPGNECLAHISGFRGFEHYFYGPNLHRYLRELRRQALDPYEAFSVGETPGIGRQTAKLLTAPPRRELDMIFNFDHLENPGKVRGDDYRYDLNYYKEYIIPWMEDPGGVWMSLFYENHDNPRMISKVNPEPQVRKVLAKLLALLQMTLRGTPFVFQGQELGRVNQNFTSMDQLRDVESLNLDQTWRKTMGEETARRKILTGTRDHARVPMAWNSDRQAGFSEAEPWIAQDQDYRTWNAPAESADPDSVLNFYRRLIRLRRSHPVLVYGEIRIRFKKTRNLFLYHRVSPEETLIVECNLSSRRIRRRITSRSRHRLISNYPDLPQGWLRPYEAILWKQETKGKQ